MSDRYDFANLSPIEFESFCVDLVSAETKLRFEHFSEGADGGIDGRHGRANGDIILQAKHYKNSSWSDLRRAAKKERGNIYKLNPSEYYFLTSQPLTPTRKKALAALLDHPSVTEANIWGRAEINKYLSKNPDVEKRNIKLWLSSSSVLERLLNNDIAVFAEATYDEIERILKVFVVNPSIKRSVKILESSHCLIVSGPPGVGKTSLAQFIAAEYINNDWDLVSITSIDDGFRTFNRAKRQIFVFDDFLGKIKLDTISLAHNDSKILRFMSMIFKDKGKRFVLTTRSYILQAARIISEELDDVKVDISEMVLDLSVYTREIKARILYNHLYHSEIDQKSIKSLLVGDVICRIIDHRNYMPRIIQWMTDEIRQRDVIPKEYPAIFLQTLDKPDKIWDKAFKQHISVQAQILLYCLYFAEQELYSEPGVRLDRLRALFDRAIVEFGVIRKEELRNSMFEDTLREIKSSFIVVGKNKVNFINPSVQDYLAQEIADITIIKTISKCVESIFGLRSLWKKINVTVPRDIRSAAAVILLNSLLNNQIEGQIPLYEIAELIGNLILEANDMSYCQKIRTYKGKKPFWTDESNLPYLIERLEKGKFSHLPYARIYARYLRRAIFRFVSPDCGNAIELDSLSRLASSLSSVKFEMPDEFYENFDQLVEETVNHLDVSAIGRNDDPEQVFGEWLNDIDVIDRFSSTSILREKREELSEILSAIRQGSDVGNKWSMERDVDTWMKSYKGNFSSDDQFTNKDIISMFSSLGKLS